MRVDRRRVDDTERRFPTGTLVRLVLGLVGVAILLALPLVQTERDATGLSVPLVLAFVVGVVIVGLAIVWPRPEGRVRAYEREE